MDYTTIFLYLTFGYSVLAAVVLLIQALSRGRLLNKRLLAFMHTSILVVCGLLFCYWQKLVLDATWSTAIVLPLILGMAMIHGLSSRFLTALSQSRLGEVGTNHVCLLLALLQCVGLIQLASGHFQDGVAYLDLVCVEPPGIIREVEDQFATTDLGTKIRLYRREVTDEDYAKFATVSAQTMRHSTEKAIRRADPSNTSNCHGWVFTDGNHIISSYDVPRVLKENGYQQVEKPEINDIVTYQDKDGIVIHTGIVRALYDGSTPMVESKWGMTAVYVHLVAEQPYSDKFSYWRSSRATHQLTTYRDAKHKLDMARISSQKELKL